MEQKWSNHLNSKLILLLNIVSSSLYSIDYEKGDEESKTQVDTGLQDILGCKLLMT